MAGCDISVLMLAYNHGSYIREAIDSVLNQCHDLSVELLIGEDCSSDDTLAVCREVEAANPGTVRVVTADSNRGMHRNFQDLWRESRGRYVAFCEGDDYWLDSAKLQKQYTLLEARPDCSLCGAYTAMLHRDRSGAWRPGELVRPPVQRETYDFGQLIASYNFHFSSVMVRKSALHFPEWFTTVYCVDRPLYLLAATNGSACLLPDVVSAYRIHGDGHWAPLAMAEKAARSIDLFEKMADYFDSAYRDQFLQALAAILWDYMARDLHAGRRAEARTIFWRAARYTPAARVMGRLGLYGRVLARLYLPLPRIREAAADVS